MFMSARQAQYNILLRAKSDLAAGRITKAQFAERTGGVVYANALVAVAKRLTKLGVKGAAGVLLAAFVDDDDRERMKGDMTRSGWDALKALPGDTLTNVVSLAAFGEVAITIASAAAKGWRGWTGVGDVADIRTGNIFADLSLDFAGAAALAGKAIEAAVSEETFQTGPDKGKPKWKRYALEAGDSIASFLSSVIGGPYQAGRSAYYAGKPIVKGRTDRQLYDAIGENLDKPENLARIMGELSRKGKTIKNITSIKAFRDGTPEQKRAIRRAWANRMRKAKDK